MDLIDQAQVLLRNAGYRTQPLGMVQQEGLRFEDDTVLGFLYVFQDVTMLLSGWEGAQRATLVRSAPQLRLSRDKAWNIYAVFITDLPAQAKEMHAISRIEEDFAATRKIARAGVISSADLQRALLPLLPLRTPEDFGVSDYMTKMRSRLSMLPGPALEAMLGSAPAEELVRILMEQT
jgi:hypothetical protein